MNWISPVFPLNAKTLNWNRMRIFYSARSIRRQKIRYWSTALKITEACVYMCVVTWNKNETHGDVSCKLYWQCKHNLYRATSNIKHNKKTRTLSNYNSLYLQYTNTNSACIAVQLYIWCYNYPQRQIVDNEISCLIFVLVQGRPNHGRGPYPIRQLLFCGRLSRIILLSFSRLAPIGNF